MSLLKDLKTLTPHVAGAYNYIMIEHCADAARRTCVQAKDYRYKHMYVLYTSVVVYT